MYIIIGFVVYVLLGLYTHSRERERERERARGLAGRAKWYTLVDISMVVVAVEHVDKDKLTTYF